MKIIFGVFDNLDAKLLSKIKYFDIDTHGAFDSGSVYFIVNVRVFANLEKHVEKTSPTKCLAICQCYLCSYF